MSYIPPSKNPTAEQRARSHEVFVYMMRQCGGYSQNFAEKFWFEQLGYYQTPREIYKEVEHMAYCVSKVIRYLARRIREDSDLKKSRLQLLPQAERDFYENETLPKATSDCFSIRVDFILPRGDKKLKILEVNVANIAGAQVCHFHLEWLRQFSMLEPSFFDSLALEKVEETLKIHHTTFISAIRNHLNLACRNKDGIIAYVYLDDDESKFLANYQVWLLNQHASENNPIALAVKPDAIFRANDRLMARDEKGTVFKIALLYRDFLNKEMFVSDGALQESVKTLLRNALETNTFVIPSLTDRMVDLKDLLALFSGDTSLPLYILCGEVKDEIESLLKWTPKTRLVYDFGEFKLPILKPCYASGGEGIGYLTDGMWVLQEAVEPEIVRADGNDWYFVHGAVIYCSPDDDNKVAGIFTRMSRHPIVSFKRGAQVVPNIIV